MMRSCRRLVVWPLVLLCVTTISAVSAFCSPSLVGSHVGRAGHPIESVTVLNYVEYRQVLGSIEDFYTECPVQSAFLTCAIKAHAADAIAQLRSYYGEHHVAAPSGIENAVAEDDGTSRPFITQSFPSVDFQLPRNVAFLLYGGMYQGVAQHFIYNALFPLLFPAVAGFEIATVACKVLTDITFFGPLISLPMSFAIKSAVFGSTDPLKDGLEKYQKDVLEKDLLFKYWGLWGPVNCLTFSVVPPHLRIAFVASVSFFWMICLSTLSNQEATEKESSVQVAPAKSDGVQGISTDWSTPISAFSKMAHVDGFKAPQTLS